MVYMVLSVAGELDMATRPRLEGDVNRAISAATTGNRCVVIDLDGVRFCDLSGLDALRAGVDATHHRVVLLVASETEASPGNLRRLLTLLARAGRPQALPLYTSLAEVARSEPVGWTSFDGVRDKPEQ